MGGKVTAGPWTGCHNGECPCGYIFGDGGKAYIAKTMALADDVEPVAIDEDRIANGKFLIAAVNACFHVSPNNPQAVAEAIPEIVNMLARFVSATERWNVEVEKIIGRQPETGIQISEARALLSSLSLKEQKHP